MKQNVLPIILCAIVFLSGCSCTSSKIPMIDSTAVKPLASYSPGVSFVGDGLIYCEADVDNCVFELHAHDGKFAVRPCVDIQHFVTNLTIEGSDDVHWENYGWYGKKTFLEILIKKNDKYVGYAVVAVEDPDDDYWYDATVIECKEISPQKSQEYELTAEMLQEMIDTVIQNNSAEQ